ncbi:MAG TPA: zinc-binding dehydrogenase [Roseiflexaceae bacterium]|nr:zinc-binding dehydrogenase [Roseiflexaceae bacterium]
MQGVRAVMPEPYRITIETYEVPAPGPGQVLVATEASGISPGTELAIYTGIHQWLKDPTRAWPKFPFVAGYSAVGRVAAVGAGVTRLKEGDRVIWPGRHESHALVAAEGEAADIWPIAEHVSASSAALLSLARFPLSALVQSQRILGQAVAVLGLGLIGQITARLYSAAGAFPIVGIDTVAGRRSRAEATYGVRTVDPAAGDALEAVRALLGGARPDVVVDATGVPAALQDALRLVADGGQVVLVGSPRGLIQQFDTYWDLHGRSVTVTGAHGSAIGASVRERFPFTRARALPLLVHLLESGKLRLDDLVTHAVDGRELDAMYRGLLERRDEFLGVTLHWGVAGS